MCDEWRAGLLAQVSARGMNLELIWATLGLVVAVLAGVIAIVWVDRWRKRARAEGSAPADDLDHYQELLAQGLLNPEEYERIRSRLQQGSTMKADERIKPAPGPSTAVRPADTAVPPAGTGPTESGPP